MKSCIGVLLMLATAVHDRRTQPVIEPTDSNGSPKEQEEVLAEFWDYIQKIINAADEDKRILQLAFCCGLITSSSWLLSHPDIAPLGHSVIMLQKNLQYKLFKIGCRVQGSYSSFFLQAIATSPLLLPGISPLLSQLACSPSSQPLPLICGSCTTHATATPCGSFTAQATAMPHTIAACSFTA